MKTNNIMIVWLGFLITGMIAVAVSPHKAPTTPVIKSGTLTIDQAIEIYEKSTGNALKTPVYYADSTLDIFQKLPDSLAICAVSKSGDKKIIINTDYWKSASDTKRVYILFHEIGHCDFDMDHTDDPDHFMYYGVDEHQLEMFKKNFKSVVKELQ